MAGIQEEIALENSDASAKVSVVPDGPQKAIDAITQSYLSQRSALATEGAEEAATRGMASRSKRHSRLFNMSVPADCEAYSDLRQKLDMGLVVIRRDGTLKDGVQLAFFVEWMEFEKEVAIERADLAELGDRFLDGLAADKTAKEAAAKTVKRKRVRRQRGRRAEEPPPVVDLEAAPKSVSKGGQ